MEINLIRGLIYKFFSLALSYPGEENLKQLKSIVEDLTELDYSKLYDLNLREIVENYEKEKSKELEVEYVSLFINAYPKLPCPPYESFYRAGRLNDPNIISDLMRTYGLMGVEPKKELPDHAVILLEFMYFLNMKALKDNMDLEQQKTFFNKHIKTWLKRFAECTTKNAKKKVYAEIGRQLNSFIEQETDIIESI